jgi:hypothetical protein
MADKNGRRTKLPNVVETNVVETNKEHFQRTDPIS